MNGGGNVFWFALIAWSLIMNMCATENVASAIRNVHVECRP